MTKIKLLTTFLLSIFYLNTFSQSIKIDRIEGKTCLNDTIKVYFSGEKIDQSNGNLQIQFSDYNSNNVLWKNLQTFGNKSPLKILVTNTLITSYYQYFRIKSISQNIVSSNFQNQNTYKPKANVQLVGETELWLSKYDPIPLSFSYTGAIPITVVMSDNTSFILDDYNKTKNIVAINQSTLSIKKVSNACGVGVGTGKVKINFNEANLKIAPNTIFSSYCPGGELTIPFSAEDNAALKNLKIKLINQLDSSKKNIYVLNPRIEKNEIKASLNNEIPIGNYQVLAESENPKIYALIANQIIIKNKPSLTFNYLQKVYENTANIEGSVNSYAPYTIELSDGTKITSKYDSYFRKTISPKNSTSYSIKSFDTECGLSENFPKDTFRINVIKKIHIDWVTPQVCVGGIGKIKYSSNIDFNADNKFYVKLRESIWNPQIVRLKIEAKKISRDTLEFTFPQNFTVPEPSFLTIETTSPANTENDESKQFNGNIFLKILYKKPTAKISDLFKSKELSISESVNIPFNFTGGYPVEYGYSINNKKFTASSNDSISNQYSYINTTSNIKLDYVKNACGLGTVSGDVTISIKDSKPDTALKVSFLPLEKSRYCHGEKIPIKFEVKNNTQPKQSFSLMVRHYDNYQLEKALENITENTIIDAGDFLKVGTHELILVSTKNPNFTSQTIQIEIDTKPSASMSFDYSNYYNNTSNTFMKGTPVIVNQYVSGTPPFKITYSDNSDTILNSNSSSQKTIYPIKDGEIFIKSISNACGINTDVSNAKLSYKIKPFIVENFRIENLPKINSSYDSPIMCRKKKYTFLFDVKGEIPKDSSLYLKIGTTQFNNYQEFTIFDKIVQKNIQTSFSFQIPDSLENGHYVFMIDDKPETVTIKGYNNSSLVHVKIIDTPQIHLGLMNLSRYYDPEYYYYNYDHNKLIDYKTSKPKQDTTIQANENVAMGFYDKSNLSSIYNIYVNAVVEATDLVTNTKTYSYHNQSNQFLSVNPQNNTTYKIIKASNECGVGTGEGEVKVTTSPNVEIDYEYYKTKDITQSSSDYYSPKVCFGKSVQFRIKNYLNNSPNEKIQLYLNIFSKSNNKEKIYLGDFTAKDSIITLNIPERKPEEIEAYSVSIVNMNLGINKVLIQNLNLKGKPNLVLLGNAVINQGDSTNLFVSNLYSSVQYFNYTNYLEYSKDTLHIEWNDNHKSVSSNNGASRIVKPSTTTEYSIKNSSNECGVGVANGKITITVNPPSERQIFFDKTQINVSSDSLRLNNYYYNENAPLCKNSKMYVQFLTKGTFTKNNVFTVEVADKDGKNFKSLKTKSFKNGLVADTPNDILSNEYLLLKIVASDPNTTSTTTQFIVKNTIKAYFQSQFYTQENGKTKNLKIVLENIPGHNYYNYVKVNLLELTKGQEIKEIYLKDEVTELKLPFNETNEYRILNGYDYDQYYYNGWYGNEYYPNRGITIGCPLEIISPKTAKYQIEQITANEKDEKLSAKVFPNPTTDKINIETDGSPFSVQIFDITGILRQSHANSSNNNQLDISQLPKGTYILNVYSKKKKASFRIIKL